jgi:hypothetical protein
MGGMVNVEGETEKDLFVIGGNVYLNSPVGEDLRIAGGNISINTRIGGDLLVAGGTVILSERAEVAGDLWVAGGSVIINAPVRGEVRVAGGEVTLNSKIDGEVNARVGQRLVFGPKAQISSRVLHRGPNEAVRQSGSQVDNVQFELMEQRNFDKGFKALATGAFLIKLVAWFLAGWLLLHFRKNRVRDLAQHVKDKTWESLGLGLAVLILAPIVGIVLLFTVVGYYIGLVVLAGYIATLLVINLVSALVLGYWLLPYLNKRETKPIWQIALLGAVVWHILGLIPVIGWLVCLVVFLLTLGSAFKSWRRQEQAE